MIHDREKVVVVRWYLLKSLEKISIIISGFDFDQNELTLIIKK